MMLEPSELKCVRGHLNVRMENRYRGVQFFNRQAFVLIEGSP
ncbi:hypothetical protein THOM_2779 [Trachipleistophora hominis]|uniref:Uncharacterized protein n=1 Tax=Trachipleistophora hominis TaxID=72359 RepID=L7JU84_TRAHO|nr:hypothetical protein THOM_2779 [Trachipleistophora hominis]